jgi:hypothetical protein
MEWKEILKVNLIMHDFHQEYKVTKVIGKGHFAKVYYAHQKDNEN